MFPLADLKYVAKQSVKEKEQVYFLQAVSD